MKDPELAAMAKRLKAKKAAERILRWGLSTGSTIINMACTGDPDYGFLPGHYYYFVGDSSSGKTFIGLTSMAEAALNEHMKHYKLIYDDVEGGALMDFRKFYGEALVARIQPPKIIKGVPRYSRYLEDFFDWFDKAPDEPIFYMLDSLDPLRSRTEKKMRDEDKGSYGTERAKIISARMPDVIAKLRDTNSFLLILGQTKDAIGAQYKMKTRAGGHAPTFYATLEIWSKINGMKPLKKTINGREHKIGITSSVHIKKNRVQGKDCIVEVPIYYSHGIDDVGSCIDYLVDFKHWKESNGLIQAKEFGLKARKETLVRKIEAGNREPKLRRVVKEYWDKLESALAVARKRRY